MALREIVVVENPVLRKKAKKVEKLTPEARRLIDDMIETMRDAPGVGLAAPQVGIGLRLFVCNPTGEPGDDLVCINPRFT